MLALLLDMVSEMCDDHLRNLDPDVAPRETTGELGEPVASPLAVEGRGRQAVAEKHAPSAPHWPEAAAPLSVLRRPRCPAWAGRGCSDEDEEDEKKWMGGGGRRRMIVKEERP